MTLNIFGCLIISLCCFSAPIPKLVSHIDIGGFHSQCIAIDGAEPERIEAFVLATLPDAHLSSLKIMTETMVVSKSLDCSRLSTFSWGPPETTIDPRRYAERRAQLAKSKLTAALIVADKRGRRISIRRGNDIQIRISGMDPTLYTMESLTCRLVHLSGGQPIETEGGIRAIAFMNCNPTNINAKLARDLIDRLRKHTGIGDSTRTRLLVQINNCAAFQDLEFPAKYMFELDSPTSNPTSGSWLSGRSCIFPEDVETGKDVGQRSRA